MSEAPPKQETDVPAPQGKLDEGLRSHLVGTVARLCSELEQEAITYCHWKSNDQIQRSLSGANDLDLLIHRHDRSRFESLLLRLGFRRAEAPYEQRVPGIEDFYGYDRPSAKLIHVHAHYRLLVGDDRTKDYHLPLEALFLESTRLAGCIRIPDPTVELIAFVFRMALKHATWEAILEGKGRLSPAELAEWGHLRTEQRIAAAEALLRERVPFLTDAFSRCAHTIGCESGFLSRARSARRLQKSLAVHRRRSRLAELRLKAWRRIVQAVRRRTGGNVSKRQLTCGGGIVAVVGGDGAGKTTVVDSLYQWLRSDLDTRRIHLGKPPWSLTTFVVRAIQKLGRTLGVGSYVSSVELLRDGSTPSTPPRLPGVGLLVRELCTSRDRYLLFRRACRWATGGTIVISDRFPLPVLTMDGPQIARWVTPTSGKLLQILGRWEKSYYAAVTPPAQLFVLRLRPEVAVQRKQDEESNYVFHRSQEVWQMELAAIDHELIDAERPAEEVATSVRDAFWRAMT